MTTRFDSVVHERLLQQMQSTLHDMDTLIDDLDATTVNVREQWTGEAQRAYVQTQRECDASLRRLHSLLAQARSNAQRSGERLTAANMSAAALWT